MKLNRLQLVGFGKFSDKSLELSPGLNLIYGENESGKSTLLQFIRGMLFGFKKEGGRRVYDRNVEQFRPWGGGQYYGVMEYSLEGRDFRIERNFEPSAERVKVLDGRTWQDLTASFPMDQRKEVLFAQEHLGISRTIFDNTICVRQLGVRSASELAGEIQAKLANLASAGEEDVSIQKALEVLDQAIRGIGQTERSVKTPLGRASAKIEELEKSRQETLRVYQEITEAEDRIAALNRDIDGLFRELQLLGVEAKAHRVREIQAKLDRVLAYDREINQIQANGSPTVTLAEKDALLLNLEREKSAERKAEALTEKVQQLFSQQERLGQEEAELKGFANHSTDSALSIAEHFSKLEAAITQLKRLGEKKTELTEKRQQVEAEYNLLAGCAGIDNNGEAEANQLENEISGLTLKIWSRDAELLKVKEQQLLQKRKLKTAASLILFSLGLALGLGLALWIHPALGFIGLVGLIPALITWFSRTDEQSKLQEVRRGLAEARFHSGAFESDLQAKKERLGFLLTKAGAENVRELTEKMRRYALLNQERNSLIRDIAATDRSLSQVNLQVEEQTLLLEGAFLVPAGIIQAGGVITRQHIDQFCSGLVRFRELRSGLGQLVQQINQLRSQIQGFVGEAEAARAQVREILNRAGVDTPEDFFAAWEQTVKLTELEKSVQSLALARQEVLGSFSEAELESQLAQLQCELGSSPQVIPRSTESLEREQQAIAREIQTKKELIANLKGTIGARLRGVRNLAEIEDELLSAALEKEQILKRKKALEQARQVITEVSHDIQREFAPQVNRELNKTVGLITGGRYNSSRIDQYLSMKTVVPETGEAKEIGCLSFGTIDQFHFALRTALAQIIGAKFPLILDEPFSQYDDIRLEAVMQTILELAAGKQILLFTCQRREVKALDSTGVNNCKIISL